MKSELLKRGILGVALLGALGAAVVRQPPLAGMLWIFGSVVVLSATVYPWYLLWILPWAALAGNRAWLLAACPDESIRDGKRAFASASKVCQMTKALATSQVSEPCHHSKTT